MNYFRFTSLLFVLPAVLTVVTMQSSLTQAAQAQVVTPHFNCLSPGCAPTPAKPTTLPNQAPGTSVSPNPTISQTPSSSPSQIPSVSPSTTAISPTGTQPCTDLASLPTFGDMKSPFLPPTQGTDRNGFLNIFDNNLPVRTAETNSDRKGFLGDFFQLMLMMLELLIKANGAGIGAPCAPSPSLSPSPAASISPSPDPNASSSAGIGSHNSANWAGYAILEPPSPGGSITTTWKTTNMDCGDGKGHASSWPGMGGQGNDGNIAQLGTAEICVEAPTTKQLEPIYYGWTERFPDPVVPLDENNYKVTVGDEFTATVTFQGNGKFATVMTNKSKGWTVNMPMSFDASYIPQSSEIITESSDTFPIVPRFDPISYPGSIYSPDGQKKLPLSQAPKLERIVNATRDGIIRTETSPITGDTFTNTWTHH